MSSFAYTDQDVDSYLRSPLNIDRFSSLMEDAHNKSNSMITLGPYFKDIILPIQKIEQFKYGQSNPTYLLTDSSGARFVLRRKPTSNKELISPKSHNIEREFHFLAALGQYNKTQNVDLPISKTYLLCEDEIYTGFVFYLMEFVQGVIFHDPFMNSISEEKRLKCWTSAVKTISDIHKVDTSALSQFLSSSYFPKLSSSFFERQVKTLTKISNLQASFEGVSEIPYFKEISKWLYDSSPSDTKPPTLIHGDYKIDNLVFDLETCEVTAVLDWELTTLGHPIFDLSNLLQPCVLPLELNKSINNSDSTEPFPDCVNVCLSKYYEYNSNWGNPKEFWKIGVVFGIYRVAVITQGVYMRAVKGVASSAEAKRFGQLYTLFGNLLKLEIERKYKL